MLNTFRRKGPLGKIVLLRCAHACTVSVSQRLRLCFCFRWQARAARGEKELRRLVNSDAKGRGSYKIYSVLSSQVRVAAYYYYAGTRVYA